MQRLRISDILVRKRHRKNLGNLTSLAQSIQTVGLLHPVVVKPDKTLVSGERRLAAAQSLGWDTIPVTVIHNLDDALLTLKAEQDENTCRQDLAPSEAVSLGRSLEDLERTAARKRQGIAVAARHAQNRGDSSGKFPELSASEQGRTRDKVGGAVGMGGKTYQKAEAVVRAAEEDPDAFSDLVEQMDATGKVDGAYKKMQWRIKEKAATILPRPEVISKPTFTVNSSDIWQLGKHRLMCGDAFNPEHVTALTGTDIVSAIVTDPPYGIGYKPDWNKWDGSPPDFSAVTGDDKPFDPTIFLPYPTVVLFGANYFSNQLPIGGWICWDKRLDVAKDAMFGSPFELAWYRSIHTTRKAIMLRVLHGGVVNADSLQGNNEKRLVATQKPVALMEQILDNLTETNDVIYDPFCGSGSTLMACENKGRKCLAMDIEPICAAITLQRWTEKTGITPIPVER